MKSAAACILWVLSLIPVSSADWPQWRGPDRNGHSVERINSSWPADGPKTVWQADVGTGFSSIVIDHGRAYTMGNSNNQDTVWCMDALTGKEQWKHQYSADLNPQYYEGGPGSTPTVANGRVYTIGKWGNVFCLDSVAGKVIWQRDLRVDGFHTNRWGFAGSPFLWHDLVILNAGSAGVALDQQSGRIVWSNGTNSAGYASPTLFKSGDSETLLIFAAKYLVGLEPPTGRELWRQFFETGWDTNNSDPLVHQDKIFISSFSRGCMLLSIGEGKPQVVYDNKILRNNLSPGILLGDYLYAFNGEAHTDTDLRCINLSSGELKWSRKDPGFGSLICADHKLIVLSEKGELLVAPASPDGFSPIARAKILSGVCWTPPALANGLLYVRNAKGDMRCLDLRP